MSVSLQERLASIRSDSSDPSVPEPMTFADISDIIKPSDDLVKHTTPDEFYDNDLGMVYKHPVLPQSTLPFHLWESLAYDLALDNAPLTHLAEAYGVTTDDIERLIHDNQYFGKLVSSKREEVEQVGERASTVTKFRVIASMGMREYMRRLTSQATADKDFHAMFRTALEMAELMPQKDKGVEIAVGGAGDGMTFNIYGIPGLDHLANGAPPVQAVAQPVVVDADPIETVEVVSSVPVMESL